MQVLDRGVLPPSICFSFTPSDLMQHLYFYMSWCGHYYCNSNYSIRRKHFPYLLLAYVCKGKFHIEYEEHVLDAHAGDVVFIDCSRPHFYSAKCGLEFLYVNFAGANSADIFQHLYAEYGPLIKKKSNRMIGENINSIVATYQNGEIEDPAKSSLRLYQLCAQLLARDENEEMKPINKTIRYIKANVGNPINLNMLAGIAHMSPYYYAHAFKEQTGFYVNFAGANSADIFQHLYAEYGPLIKKKSNRMIGENINSIVATYQNGEIEDPAKSSLRLYQLCAQLLARDENEEMKPINKTIRYIKANVGNPINLNMLAGIAHMSPYYYAHAFKEQTGFSPIEYVINSRIERAKVLLLTTTDTVEQIAYQVGYSASSSFITIFLKRTGSTPTDYRYGR